MSPANQVLRRPRIPPNLFSISFGLAGLSDVWIAARPILHSPQVVPDAIDLVAAAVWLPTVVGYLFQGPRRILGDLRDAVLGPFVPVAAITGMLLAVGLSKHAFGAGRSLVVVFLGITVAVGGWLTGQWITETFDPASMHPGYFLPTVAGGLVGAYAAAQVHLHALAEASFGIGLICWLLLGSILLNRLFFQSSLPAALVPTLAIEMAPPAVAGIAYAAITGGIANSFAYALGGYAVLMAIVQVRFVPLYRKLRFGPGFWAFTFSYAAAATDALEWIGLKRPAGASTYAIVIVTAISAFIAIIAIRTVIAAARGQLLPRQPSSSQ